ncbi:hypothetical protein [Halorhabdus sp. SVX81]|uniref:hypothetical protein n=1 Tax=Halorhabdus sp. SVX81 TaxID=2978283 RepID=UPI0023DC62FD|nr:hypothetical protein [Halorhabdus sp. SVX81]
MSPDPNVVIGSITKALSDKAVEKISDHISGKSSQQREDLIRQKLGSGSYRIGPRHVEHITVDLLDDAVTVLKLEIDGPHVLGNLGKEYHLTSLENISEAVEAVPQDIQATTRAVGDGFIEEVYLIVHSADPQQVHYFVSEFCQYMDQKL